MELLSDFMGFRQGNRARNISITGCMENDNYFIDLLMMMLWVFSISDLKHGSILNSGFVKMPLSGLVFTVSQ